MYGELREPGRAGSRRSGSTMTEAQASDTLAALRNRLAQAEITQRGLSQRLGVRLPLDGRSSIDGNAGVSLRDVPSQQESGQRLQEALQHIYGSMGRPEAEAARLADAGSRDFAEAEPGADLVEHFKRIYGNTPAGVRLAEAAAKGRDW